MFFDGSWRGGREIQYCSRPVLSQKTLRASRGAYLFKASIWSILPNSLTTNTHGTGGLSQAATQGVWMQDSSCEWGGRSLVSDEDHAFTRWVKHRQGDLCCTQREDGAEGEEEQEEEGEGRKGGGGERLRVAQSQAWAPRFQPAFAPTARALPSSSQQPASCCC